MAEMFFEKYQEGDAERELLAARQIDPGNPDALCGLALIKVQNRRLAPAAKMCAKALERNPRHIDAFLIQALIEWIDGDQSGASGSPPPEGCGAEIVRLRG